MTNTIFAQGFSEQPLWWNDAAPSRQAHSQQQDAVDVVVVGCVSCGIVMMSWLGRQLAQKLLGTAAQPSVFEGLAFKKRPLCAGKPWFLPIIGNWWRLRDWIEITAARRGNN